MSIKLKKLFGKNSELDVILKNLSSLVGSPVQLKDSNNSLLIDSSDAALTHQFPLEFEGEVLGWLEGNENIESIVQFLNTFIAREAKNISMVNEVLDSYREITLLYNLSEKLTSSLEIQQVIQVALSEATRLIQATSGLVMLTEGFKKNNPSLTHYDSRLSQ